MVVEKGWGGSGQRQYMGDEGATLGNKTDGEHRVKLVFGTSVRE